MVFQIYFILVPRMSGNVKANFLTHIISVFENGPRGYVADELLWKTIVASSVRNSRRKLTDREVLFLDAILFYLNRVHLLSKR